MNIENIQNRFNDLNNVLVFDTLSREKFFTPGQRICINQERASMFEYINFLNNEMLESDLRKYKVPSTLENKIEFVISKINNEHN